MRKNKMSGFTFLLIILFFTLSLPTQAEDTTNIEEGGIELKEEESIKENEQDNEIQKEKDNDRSTEFNSLEVKKSTESKLTENEVLEEQEPQKENKKEYLGISEKFNENPVIQENEQDSNTLEESVQTEDTATSKENKNLINQSTQGITTGNTQDNMVQPQQGLIGVKLLSDTSLDAQYSGDKKQIILTYEGSGALNLGIGENTYFTFRLPSEISNLITEDNITISYDFSGVNLLTNTEEIYNIEDNQVSLRYFSLFSLSIGGDFQVTLTLDFEELPITENGKYVFMAEATNQLINLSLLSNDVDIATATLEDAPQIPSAPLVDEPIYTTDTQVTGTGEPNTIIHLQIGNEEYTGQVDSAGDFSVTIPEQTAGTEILASIINELGHESVSTSVIVEVPPDTTPPEAPILNPVFSNDTVVTGEGEAHATVTLTADGSIVGEGIVDDKGNFSVDIPAQEPNKIISATLTDQARNISEATVVTVIEATVSFYQVPENLTFVTTGIGSGVVTIPRVDSNWSLEVIDTRGSGSPFSIFAKAEQPLSAANGSHTLPNSLIYVDESGNETTLADSVEVYSGQTEEDPLTDIQWLENQGPLVKVNTNQVYAQTYNTTITWTLQDAPEQ